MLLVTGAMMILQTIWGTSFPPGRPSSALLLSFVISAPQGIPVIQADDDRRAFAPAPEHPRLDAHLERLLRTTWWALFDPDRRNPPSYVGR